MSAQDLLMPGGNPLGTPGGKTKNRQNIREAPGGQSAANNLFGHLTKGGKANTPAGYPGTGIDLPGGGWVGMRPVSKSGPPTIDIDIPNIPIKKIKFV
jgi:hypothetical protein